METKKCVSCGKEKSSSEFYKRRNTKSGLYSSCKECRKKYLARWNRIKRLSTLPNSDTVVLNHEDVKFISCDKCKYLEDGKCRGFLFNVKRPERNGCTFGKENDAFQH